MTLLFTRASAPHRHRFFFFSRICLFLLPPLPSLRADHPPLQRFSPLFCVPCAASLYARCTTEKRAAKLPPFVRKTGVISDSPNHSRLPPRTRLHCLSCVKKKKGKVRGFKAQTQPEHPRASLKNDGRRSSTAKRDFLKSSPSQSAATHGVRSAGLA